MIGHTMIFWNRLIESRLIRLAVEFLFGPESLGQLSYVLRAGQFRLSSRSRQPTGTMRFRRMDILVRRAMNLCRRQNFFVTQKLCGSTAFLARRAAD